MGTPFLQFDEFRRALIGLDVSHVWRGYGSALFVEFGALKTDVGTRRDGSQCNPQGELCLMVEWSWRIENRTSILCGSWSDESIWQATFDRLKGAQVAEASLFGRLLEISIELTNGLFIVSFMTAEGDPEWALGDCRASEASRWLSVQDGQLRIEVC